MRQTYLAEQSNRGAVIEPTVEQKLNEIALATQKTETALATFVSSRAVAQMAPAPQPGVPKRR